MTCCCHRTPRNTTVTQFRRGYSITRKNTDSETVEIKTGSGKVYIFRWIQGKWQAPEGCPDYVAHEIPELLQEDSPRALPPLGLSAAHAG